MNSGAEPELLSRPDARFGLVEELQPHLGPALADPLLPLRQLIAAAKLSAASRSCCNAARL